MARLRCALLVALAWPTIASANGRQAATSTINFQQGHPDHITAGMTFGMLQSHDGGTTWSWMCEAAVGYGGMYEPSYAYTSSSALFATTFDGLKVNRNGCTFDSTPPGMTFVSLVKLASTGTLYITASDQNDSKIYQSTDDGVTFPVSASPGLNNDWWDSLVFAPSDPMRVYLSGYRFVKSCNELSENVGAACVHPSDCTSTGAGSGSLHAFQHQPNHPAAACETHKVFLLFASTDGGTTFTRLSIEGIGTTSNSVIDVVGVDPTRPDIAYIHVSLDVNGNNPGDSIYKTTNGGGVPGDTTAWHKLLVTHDPVGISFLVRSNGDLIAGTETSGTLRSTAGDACIDSTSCAWQMLASPPHVNCLVENPATLATTHEVWACTENYDTPGIQGDGYGIMKTTDFVTWQPVLRFQDIAGPVSCAAGTAQQDQCVESYMGHASVWCCLEMQLGITAMTLDANGRPLCTGANSCEPTIGADAGTKLVKPIGGGCCGTGGGGAGALVLGLGTAALLIRSRRRRSRYVARMTDRDSLDALRAELGQIDREIFALVARRQAAAQRIGQIKRETGVPTRDFRQEKDVVARARTAAIERGLPGALGEELILALIRSSLTVQEKDTVAALGEGSGRRALVIGGAGHMGRWFVRYLRAQGFSVAIADPDDGAEGIVNHRDWRERHARPRADRDRGVDAGDRRDPRSDGGGAPDGDRIRHRLAEEPAAQGPARAACGRSGGDLGASDVRPRHRVAQRSTRDLRRSRLAEGQRRGARAVRADDGDPRRDGSRESRSVDRLRARAVACGQHRVLHRARRER